MNILSEKLQKAGRVAITGHIRPDGDCVGSCLGLYNYLKKQYPEIRTTVYLEKPSVKFDYLQGFQDIVSVADKAPAVDLCICLDASDKERLGDFGAILDGASDSLCIDHHVTNTSYAADTVLEADASSTCEVLYGLLDAKAIDKQIAECIYTGIIHDTGVFKYSCTSENTMRIAGEMMSKGIDFGDIIDSSFYRKTYLQNQVLGRALLESITFLDGKCVFSAISRQVMDFYSVDGKDMDGVIDQLRNTEGIECAIFLYETGAQEYKVSMRSNHYVDVSKIAAFFGGGGHVRAAGCNMSGSLHDIINNLSSHIEKQLKES